MKNRTNKQTAITTGLVLTLLTGTAASSYGQLVSGWGAETGFASGTVTEGAPGSFSVAPTGNIGERADLATSVDFSAVGSTVQLTGSLTSAAIYGNQQLRIGLLNNNGNSFGTLDSGAWTGATTSGWLGYVVEIGNGSGTGTTATYGRNGNGGNAWLSTSGAAYNIMQVTDTGAGVANGTYTFDLELTRLSTTSVGITYSFLETDGLGNFSATGSFTDSGGLSSGMSSFDAVGFYTPGAGNTTSFTGVTVVVPEPSTLALAGLGLAGLLAFRRRQLA